MTGTSFKERLKISRDAKFERDLWKTNTDIVPQSRRNLQAFVWWVGSITSRCSGKRPDPGDGGNRAYMVGGKFVPPTIQLPFVKRSKLITFKLGKFPNSKALFQSLSMDIR